MKILVNDNISDKGIEILEDQGYELTQHHYEKDELMDVLPDYDAIIIRSATKVREDLIDKSNLKVIARAGTGIDNIDHEYARSKGIQVLNTPGANSASVSELVFAHMFALARYIPQANITMRKGEWNKKQYRGIELAGKTLGIMGFGKIGEITAKMALGFGMNVVAYDIADIDTDLDVEFKSKEEVLKESDFLTLHVPSMDEPFITAEDMKTMKNSAYLVNCARGGVVDEDDLLAALDNGDIAGAGVDVYVDEPTDNEDLVNHKKVSVTPHIGAATYEAQDRVGIQIAEKLIDALEN
ncbi:MAG: D-2-hydroxyacid dehydrogenase [Candidatus Marinimicrobia bacterium]|nr:D-2-hydroxyacid dehydrogenase [Candidatus Neomarinimicrobiota bacterium]